MKKSHLFLTLILIVNGCTNLHERYEQADDVTTQAVYAYALNQNKKALPNEHEHNLVLFRARGLTADICNMAIYINQTRTAVLHSEQKICLRVPVGKITIQTHFEGNKYCSNLGVDDKTLLIEPQTITTMVLSVFGNGGVKFDQLLPQT